MSVESARAALQGEAVAAFGMTWVPPHLLRSLTWGSGVENDPEALAAVAQALALDVALVPAEAEWAAEAAALLTEADVAAAWAVAGVLGRVGDEVGWMDVLKRSAAEPGELSYPLAEALHAALDDVRRGIAAGAQVILVADDLAGATGWLVSPDFVLEALMPSYRRLAGEAIAAGAVPVFHSDGDVRAVLEALAKSGYSGVHFGLLGAEQLSAAVTAARAAGLVPIGGIEARALIAEGARRPGERAARLALEGPLVIADDGGITTPEEIAAFAAAIRDARRFRAMRREDEA